MRFSSALRIIRTNISRRSLRETYWGWASLAGEVRKLWLPRNRAFRREVFRNFSQYLFSSPAPVSGETQARARLAVDWLLRAQAATPDDGVSLGYFPCEDEHGDGWRTSYPETTGYIITSLLAYARQSGDQAVADAAMRMARWEMAVQMPSGAVQGGPVCPPQQQTAAAFNTGMVLDGWCSAYEHAADPDLLAAARRAADFLVNDLDERGYFKTNGAFVSKGEIKTYTCLCAWAIYRFGVIADDASYKSKAVAAIEAALQQQQANGWFAHNCLTQSDAPLTHTIGYTLQGVLEVGVLAGRQDFIDAVRKTLDAVLPRVHDNGYLAGRFYSDWEPAAMSSCLTGSAQIAIVCYRLSDQTGHARYRAEADKLLNFLKNVQLNQPGNDAMKGSIAGSFPLFGSYMRAGYPNWATKYLLDGLMLQAVSPSTSKMVG